MKKVLVIGIGAGDPEHVTQQAVRALNEADVFFALDKGAGKEDLAALREEICDRFIDGTAYRVVHTADPERRLRDASYEADVRAWHEQRLDLYEGLVAGLADDEVGAFLVWGDPSLYDSTLRILDQLAERGTEAFTVEVIPGISSVQVLAARFGIALHAIGAPVRITTGRLLAEGWPEGAHDVVVMLDGSCSFTTVDPEGLDIYWGAYLGTPDEILLSGPLGEVADEIRRVRAEARARKGWMFDTYLIRRRAER
ncbi:MAG: precorrin-6A synthase (deacetylating) [Acidimicrobiales bacterium]|nr:precorrin-6A synthase (deacetylating) [Acidimicrobiales bacterium]